jgi:two-component SAPR family response regulator
MPCQAWSLPSMPPSSCSANIPDAALLDVNLQGESVTPLAEECQLRKIPFIVITGYGRLSLSDSLLNGAVRVRKPFNRDDVAKALTSVIRVDR